MNAPLIDLGAQFHARHDRELIALGHRFGAALAYANTQTDLLPEDMPVDDEFAAIDAATVPIMTVVDEIMDAWAYTPAGYAVQSKVSMWAYGV
ncbi:hypothetical protein NKH75_23950 [Mesorhizobium sp. M0984]|uniref:hypothetical protein n=1 Tax=Mesorhizobium sp. M0984 TaxID=2957041 RepID=UPI0033350446